MTHAANNAPMSRAVTPYLPFLPLPGPSQSTVNLADPLEARVEASPAQVAASG
jgi:hypothetical protein